MTMPESPVAEMPRTPAVMKFTYPSGARPLDGFTIKRGVGRGGFGEVYFATSDAGKEVALKLIRRNLDVELRGATQCLNLKHPNLIGLYDIRTDDMGDQWIIMEYVSGDSLEDAIERHPNGMPNHEMLGWIRGVCAGVAYLHDHGIVHRDLKPGNIFLDEGTVKIGDYGLAKFISCSRRSGQTESVGTVHYMAPEIANGRYGREIDTYALGIILYEMLTGTVPFEGESVGEVLMKHLTAEPDLSRLEEPYRDIVRLALAKDPEIRLKSVNQMLALLPGGGEAATMTGQPPIVDDIPLTPIVASVGQVTAKKSCGPKAASPAQSNGYIEEPIWKAIRETLSFSQNREGVADPQKRAQSVAFAWAVIVFLLIFGQMVLGFRVLGLVVPVLVCYAVYYVIWVSAIRPSVERQSSPGKDAAAVPGQPNRSDIARVNSPPTSLAAAEMHGKSPVLAPPAAYIDPHAEKARRKRLRKNWRELAHRELAEKSHRDKLRELTGSMFMAALIAAALSFAGPVLGLGNLATYLWLAITSTLATWAILISTKLLEGKLDEQAPMRITMLVLGALVGLASYGLGEALLVTLPRMDAPIGVSEGFLSHHAFRWPQPGRYTNDFSPVLSMYVTFFATLFLLPRWWREAEFTRSTRLSWWSVASCMFVAWLVHLFWWFPQPAGIMIAGITSFATQLASPWMPTSRRRALAEQVERGT
jgi:serine/threonine protein kinase